MPDEPKDPKVVSPPGEGDEPTKPQGSPAASGEGAKEEWFLEVDDRTRYRTKEDAVKGWKDTKKHASDLSEYATTLKDYGITSKEELDEVLEEYGSLSRKALDADDEAQAATGKEKKPPPAASASPSDGELTDEDKRAIAYFKRVGVVTKEDFRDLQKALDSLNKQQEALYSREQDTVVQAAQQELGRLLEKSGLPAEKFSEPVEDYVRAWIERQSPRGNDGEPKRGTPLYRFQQGGREAMKVVDEGFAAFRKVLEAAGWKQSAEYKETKGKQQAKAGKTLPADGAPKPGEGEPKKGAPSPLSGFPTTVHDKAWDLLQQATGKE
jgi:DNA-directed RNA polymerase subunit F